MIYRPIPRLLICAALLSGCDEGVEPGSDPEFRETTSCLKTGTLPSATIVAKGIPDPEDPYGKLALEFVPELVDEFVLGYARMQPANEKLCDAACDSEDLGWTGENCVVERDYSTGGYKEYEVVKGTKRWGVDVKTGDTVVGCACE
jgi:hypothetical protein